MKEYLFDKEDFEILKQIKSKTPIKIWWEMIRYIFEYENYYISLEIQAVEKLPLTDTHPENVVAPKFEIINEKFTPSEIAVLISKNQSITTSYIVRTILYFETPRAATSRDKKRSLRILKGIGRKNRKYISGMIEGAKTYSKFTCHPDYYNESEKYEPHLVDVGYLFILDDKIIKCFLEENSDDFNDFNEKYIVDYYNFEKEYKSYKFTKTD